MQEGVWMNRKCTTRTQGKSLQQIGTEGDIIAGEAMLKIYIQP